MSEEESAKKASTILNDFIASKDIKKAQGAIKGEFLGRGGSGAVALYTWITQSFEKEESERPTCKVSTRLVLHKCCNVSSASQNVNNFASQGLAM